VIESVDHLLVGAADLDAGIEWVEERTGVRAAAGGVHPGGGTRNALLSLQRRRYLEVIAPDPAQSEYRFRVDVRSLARPQLVTWAAATPDADGVARKARAAGFEVAGPDAGSRARPDGVLLRWKIVSVKNDLGSAGVEPIPFFIEWDPRSPHPSIDSPGGCDLLSFRIAHPRPADVIAALDALGISLPVDAAERPRLTATLSTPRGEATLN
jgi:Glyoxalase-like domain